MAIHFEVGEEVVEVWGTDDNAKRRRTKISGVFPDGTCTTSEGRLYDSLTGAAVPRCEGYRAIHTAEKYKHLGKLLERARPGEGAT